MASRAKGVARVAWLVGWLGLAAFGVAWAGEEAKPLKLNTTADHSKFKELQREFKTGPELTKACLSCHTEAAGQIHRTKHWKWEYLNPETKQVLGKKTIVNNFCISIASNYASCTSCHVGYGWKDAKFDFKSEENVDCVVCHDTTGNYRKPPGLAGNVVTSDTEFPAGSGKIIKGIDLTKIAQKVGKSSRDTCGACHFNGGGGDGVKHGDLDSSMAAPDKELDVHMDAAGLDFTCATCHKTSSHDVAGSRYAPTAKDAKGAHLRGAADNGNPATCVSCHGKGPHKKEARLNEHATKVACQTCHIPTFARGGVATKMTWDWSTAGQRDANGQPIVRKDAKGRIVYESRKGDFTLAENVKPEYAWFNGQVNYTLLTDKIEKSAQPHAHQHAGRQPHGRQIHDLADEGAFVASSPTTRVNKTLITPHTAGNDDTGLLEEPGVGQGHRSRDEGSPAHRTRASSTSSRRRCRGPSPTWWRRRKRHWAAWNAMPADGRLAGIDGCLHARRDANALIDKAGWALALLTLLGVTGTARCAWCHAARLKEHQND